MKRYRLGFLGQSCWIVHGMGHIMDGMTDKVVLSPVIPSITRLLHNENHVWHINPEEITDLASIEYCFSILSADEKKKLSRFHFKKDRHQYLVSHAFLRSVLSQYMDVMPLDWRFSIGEYGRPRIAYDESKGGVEFNLTHTAGLTVCVISTNEMCGVDAEKIIPKSGLLDVAEQIYPSADCDQLKLLLVRDETIFLQYFYSQWVLREAYAKATGLGVTDISGGMNFTVKSDDNIVFLTAQEGVESQGWKFQLLDLSPAHIVAVAFGAKSMRKNISGYSFCVTNNRGCFESFQRGLLFSD